MSRLYQDGESKLNEDSRPHVLRKFFRYEPFLGTQNIRLLEILVEDGKFSTRKFNLIEANLDVPESIPTYTALSYTWGGDGEDVVIEIDAHPFQITRNLAEALDSIIDRVAESCRYLWVDQICINQQDRLERNNQVRYMSAIYAKATAVCAWLGKPYEDHTVAIDILRSWKTHTQNVGRASAGPLLVLSELSKDTENWSKMVSSVASESAWNAIRQLSQRFWWGRAWVVQEATSEAHTYCMCGNAWIPFDELSLGLLLARIISQMPGYTFKPFYTRWTFSMLMIADLRRHRQLHLLDALQFLRVFACTDARDRVYAILGLVERNEDIIVPDYGRSLAQVYTDAVRYCLARYPPRHQLNFLAYVSGSPEVTDDQAWPSFVPNWDESGEYENFKKSTQEYNMENPLYNASLDSEGAVSLDGNTLTLDAFDVDTVSQVGAICATENDMATVQEAWRPKDPDAAYPAGGTQLQAYLHTLIGDVYRTPKFGLERGAHFQADFLKQGALAELTTDDVQRAHHMRVSLRCTIVGRRFFRTAKGYMGIGPVALQVGDKICGFLGGQMLYGVRSAHPTEGSADTAEVHRFVGECYVEGLMDGQALKYSSDGSIISYPLKLS